MARSSGVPIVAEVAGMLAMTGAFETVSVKDCVTLPALFAAVSVIVYGPRALLSGVPAMVAVPSPLLAR